MFRDHNFLKQTYCVSLFRRVQNIKSQREIAGEIQRYTSDVIYFLNDASHTTEIYMRGLLEN